MPNTYFEYEHAVRDTARRIYIGLVADAGMHYSAKTNQRGQLQAFAGYAILAAEIIESTVDTYEAPQDEHD